MCFFQIRIGGRQFLFCIFYFIFIIKVISLPLHIIGDPNLLLCLVPESRSPILGTHSLCEDEEGCDNNPMCMESQTSQKRAAEAENGKLSSFHLVFCSPSKYYQFSKHHLIGRGSDVSVHTFLPLLCICQKGLRSQLFSSLQFIYTLDKNVLSNLGIAQGEIDLI